MLRNTLLIVVAGLASPAAWLYAGEKDAPIAETRPASSLGTQAMTCVGRIQPRGLPTTYWFEYGSSPEFGSKTKEQQLPPRLAAYYHENWDHGTATWLGGLSGKDLVHHAKGGASRGFVRFSEPSANDPNHVDGIGMLHLSSYFYPSTHPNRTSHLAYLAGGIPDFRDAKVTLFVRGNKWAPNGSEMVWWTQSDILIKEQLTANWRRANWAYTGFSLNDALRSGRWERVEYRLLNDPHNWTYGGNNLAQRRPNYTYASIDFSQGNVSVDFFHLLAFVDSKNLPAGSVDFDEFELAYRNYSVLLPSNGGKLVNSPKGSPDDPATLTDGWRHGPKRMWRSVAQPTAPLEFVYTLRNPVTIETVQIHQHPDWPSKDVEVLVSTNGKTWTTLLKSALPEKLPVGPNFVFSLKRGLSQKADHVKVRVLSGYKPEHWGLGEIELFGSGAVMGTDNDWYFVNGDITDLKPGQTYHYRLAAKTSAGTVHGDVQTYTVPKDTKPLLTTGKASRITSTTAKLGGRLNPLGLRTQFHFEYGPDTKIGHKTPSQYGGLQITPRTVFANLTGLKSSTKYHYRIVGTNESGTTFSSVATFTTAAK